MLLLPAILASSVPFDHTWAPPLPKIDTETVWLSRLGALILPEPKMRMVWPLTLPLLTLISPEPMFLLVYMEGERKGFIS
jgi:hypothetical protein